MGQQALLHPVMKKALLGRIERDACYSRWSGHTGISRRFPWEPLELILIPDPSAFAHARKPSALDRYTISDSWTSVYPTDVEGLAPFHSGHCGGEGEAPHSHKDCQILVLGMDKARASPIMDLGQDLLQMRRSRQAGQIVPPD